MKNVKKEKDNFIQFDDFEELKEIFEDAIKIIEDKDGKKFLVIRTDEDFENFKKMVLNAYYELHRKKNDEQNSSEKSKSSK